VVVVVGLVLVGVVNAEVKVEVVVVVAAGTSRFEYGHLASLRLTTTKAETHNKKLCAHTLGDHTGHEVSLCVC
jgi:hypothetical protein